MGKYSLIIEPTAQKEIKLHYKHGNKASIKKLERILADLIEHPFIGEGQPEPLKHHLTGFWSRRINQKDRLFIELKMKLLQFLSFQQWDITIN